MQIRLVLVTALLCATVLAASGCKSKNELKVLQGTVTIDGAPVDEGTIHFSPAENANSRGAGGLVTNGAFEVRSDSGLIAGNYSVTLQAFKNTGRTIKDPQRGNIAEKKLLTVMDSPQPTKLDAANASNLTLAFSTKQAR